MSVTPELVLGRRIAAAGIIASALLATMNVAIGLKTQSVSVAATGFEFAGDVLASSIVLLGLFMAARPADDNHPYGHGRSETLAALAVGMVLAGAGVVISWRSLQAVGAVHPPPARIATVALGIAIVVRAVMSTLKFRIGRRLRSASLVADAWNDSVDILAAAAALTAVVLARYNPERFLAADHYGGSVVGMIVVVTGVRVVRDASMDLMDTMPASASLQQVRVAALSVAGVRTVEQVRARKTGLQWHVDIHIEVDPLLTVRASHDIATAVRAQIISALPWVADALIHVEPFEAKPAAPVADAE
jgi:cation diffusion facilitator family transporter